MELEILKIINDETRFKILEFLSCEEMCAVEILERLNITQPTLSHHMKILQKSKLVSCEKIKNRCYYKINSGKINIFLESLKNKLTPTEECICREDKSENK